MPVRKSKKPVDQPVVKAVAEPAAKIQEGAQQAARAVTAPAPVRRYRAVLFLGSLLMVTAAFGVLTFFVKVTPSFPIDLKITLGIQAINIPGFASLMDAVSWVGFSPQSEAFTAVIILLILGFGLQWEALMALFASIFSISLNILVKDLVQRPRPASSLIHVIAHLTDYSFPSGHVMYFTGFFGFLFFLSFTLLKPSWPRTFLMVVFGLLVALVGISRIYEGEHWASDVLGAYLLGALALVAIIQLYRWGKPRFFVKQPVAKAETTKM